MILSPGLGPKWRSQVRAEIHRIEERHRLVIRPATAGLNDPGCFTRKRLDIIRRVFDFNGTLVAVRLQPIAMVALLKAMRDVPNIRVGFGTGTTASYRTCDLQRELWEKYQAGGFRAAPPGKSWHNRGLAVDIGGRPPKTREAMQRHGFKDLPDIDPPHFSYGVRG